MENSVSQSRVAEDSHTAQQGYRPFPSQQKALVHSAGLTNIPSQLPSMTVSYVAVFLEVVRTRILLTCPLCFFPRAENPLKAGPPSYSLTYLQC